MNQPSNNSANASEVARSSDIRVMLRSLFLRRKTMCVLSGAVVVAACTLLNVNSVNMIKAAQIAADQPGDRGMTILPRGADTKSAIIPAWQSPVNASNSGASVERATRLGAVRQTRATHSGATFQPSATSENSGYGRSHGGHSGFNGTNPGTMIRPKVISSGRSRGQVQQDGTLLIPPDVPQPGLITPPPYRPDEPVANPPDAPPSASNSTPQAIYPDENSAAIQNSNSFVTPPAASTPDSNGAVFGPPDDQAPVDNQQGSIMAPPPGRPTANFAPGLSGFRATVECDAPAWMDPYYGRTERMPMGREGSPTPAPSMQLPSDFVAWWDPLVRHSAGLAPQTIPVEVATLVQQALANAPQVQVLQADPEVQYTIVRQEEAAFDWRTFLNTKYSDLNDPIGNTLTTGNNSKRFNDVLVNAQGGFRRRTTSGGELQIAQTAGHQYNNSIFLKPNAQSTSRLELSFRQPLLSKAGTVYNQSQIVLAGINSNISSDETLQDLQTHLYSVTEAYWNLYQARAEFFQRQKLLTSAQKVLQTLEGRNQVDTIPRQILRARAAVARAESRMQRAVTDIRNGESQLRLLVNDPSMINSGPLEFTPTETPAAMPSPVGLRETLETALVNRPDISRAIRQMRTASVQIGISKSEMLPRLDFIVTSYVAGLQAHSAVLPSINDQFTTGRPGYTAGFEFEVPLGNRAARARMEQRQWELKRAISAFRVTVETSLTEVEIATREVDTSYREMLGKYQAMVAAQNEVAYLQDRFNVLPMIEDSSMLLLEDLLGGYERLADEESAFVHSQTGYALSIIQLRRATGTLMRSRHDSPEIEPEENEWMTARAEQTAEETEERAIRTASLRSMQIPEDSGRPPASWSQPVAAPSSRYGGMVPQNQRPGEASNAVRPASYGGHSFGSK